MKRKAKSSSLATLTRPIQPMPAEVHKALVQKKLMAAYEARPAYQRNDYLGWIARAKLPETKAKRLAIMLDELKRGSGYMKLPWAPRRRAGSAARDDGR